MTAISVTERHAAVRLLRDANLHKIAAEIERAMQRTCTVCRQLFSARADARTCSPKCRMALSRRPKVAHQRRVRDAEAMLASRPADTTLDYTVGAIDAAEARAFILRYEWLGTVGRPVARYGARNKA